MEPPHFIAAATAKWQGNVTARFTRSINNSISYCITIRFGSLVETDSIKVDLWFFKIIFLIFKFLFESDVLENLS